MDNIITTNIGVAMELPTFKSEALNKSAMAIKGILTDVFSSVNKANRRLAVELGKVAKDESYKADGFKSVGEFAEKTFGIKSSKAYQLATAGEMYNNPNAPKALKAFSYTNFAEVAKIDRDKVEKAVADGTISANSSQKQLREWATANKTGNKAKVEDTFDFYTTSGQLVHKALTKQTFKSMLEESGTEVYPVGTETCIIDNKEVKYPRFLTIEHKGASIVSVLYICKKHSENIKVKILGKELQSVLTEKQIDAFKAQGYTLE